MRLIPNQMTPVARQARSRVAEAEQRVSGGLNGWASLACRIHRRLVTFARIAVLTTLAAPPFWCSARRGRRALTRLSGRDTSRLNAIAIPCASRRESAIPGILISYGPWGFNLPHVLGAHVHSRLWLAPGRRPGDRSSRGIWLPLRTWGYVPDHAGSRTMETEDSLSVQSQLVAVPRPTGPRLRSVGTAPQARVRWRAVWCCWWLLSGFGKTSLLAEWATTTEAQVAWLSCDESRRGATAQFWSRLTAGLAARWPAMGSDAALILERPSWRRLGAGGLARPRPGGPARRAAVVIDDAQFAGGVATHAGKCCAASCRHMSVCWWRASTTPCSPRPGSGWQASSPSCEPTILRSRQVEVEQLLELAGLGREPIDGQRLRS